MKASEAVGNPGDAARSSSGETIVKRFDGLVNWMTKTGCPRKDPHSVLEIPGDDWTPLAPQVSLSELKSCGSCNGDPIYSGKYLAAVSPVSDERARELEGDKFTHCPNCAGQLDAGWECNDCGADWIDIAYPLEQRLEDAKKGKAEAEDEMLRCKAELSTLRAQLEGQWELGEKLNQEEADKLPRDTQVVFVSTVGAGIECGVLANYDSFIDVEKGGWEIYLDPRPLPTPPSEPERDIESEVVSGLEDFANFLKECEHATPEEMAKRYRVTRAFKVGEAIHCEQVAPSEPEPEVPAVPKVIAPSELKGVITWGSGERHGYVIHVSEFDGVPRLHVVWDRGRGVGLCDNPGQVYRAFTQPVLHPDGTTSPIEPTQELLEALEKE